MPAFMPWPPAGLWMGAPSPTRNTPPPRNRPASPRGRRRLPPRVVGVAAAGVRALAAGGTMDVCVVPDEEHPAHPETLGHPAVDAVDAGPARVRAPTFYPAAPPAALPTAP